MFSFNDSLKKKGLKVAQDIADWICTVQSPWSENFPTPGEIPFSIDYINNVEHTAPSWIYGFASMGMAGAYKAFGDERYKAVATRLITVLKSKQILDPFHKEHYGAIREFSPLCNWCFTRDSLSGGWGFVEMYRFTGEKEYLERAKLFGQWFLKKGMDEEGYPWSAVLLGTPFVRKGSIDYIHVEERYNTVQANCQGGCLNFLYQMYKTTGDQRWCEPMQKMADYFVEYIQQDSGVFLGILRDTKKPLDTQHSWNLLHRANDDLGTVGLLCTYHVTKDKKYLASVKKFLDMVWANQRDDGLFEDSIAAQAIALNATYEAAGLVEVDGLNDQKIERALDAMLAAQKDGFENPLMRGALLEYNSDPRKVAMRANCYALILLLKLFAGVNEYLCD